MKRLLCLGLLLCAGAAWAQPAYKSADFAGGLNSVTLSMKSRLADAGYDSSLFNCAICFEPTAVSGSLVYDSSLPILPGTGFTNVASIGPIDGVPDSTIFSFDIGSLHFQLGDAGIQGGPAIQYNNSVYNGLFFAEDFASPNGASLRLNVQGGTFSLKRLSDSALLFSGFLNVGEAGLANVADFSPAAAVPEPGSLALLAAGLLGFAVRRARSVALERRSA